MSEFDLDSLFTEAADLPVEPEVGMPERPRRKLTDSMVAVDVGSISTRAVFFDVVGGQFRFVGHASAPSTLAPPYGDASEGVRQALETLRAVTGRQFITDAEDDVIVPSDEEGRGADVFVATSSAGAPLKVAVLGLMPDASLSSARQIASAVYTEIVEVIGLGDRRPQADQVLALVNAAPDVIVLAGGTEGGASAAVMRLAETAALAAYMLPAYNRPEVLYVGNSAIRDEVTELFEEIAVVHTATNLRPDLERELLDPARRQLVQMFQALRVNRRAGFENLMRWTEGYVVPTVQAAGPVLRFMSLMEQYAEGVLSVDVGAANTEIVVAHRGELITSVYTDLGVGHSAYRLLQHYDVADVMRWLPFERSANDVRDYIYNKSIRPQMLPDTVQALALEQALANLVAQEAIKRSREHWPAGLRLRPGATLPSFDVLIGGGAVLTGAGSPQRVALALVNAVQPVGVVELFSDAFGLFSGLGLAARYSPLAAVQVLDAIDFMRLGTVIAVDGVAAMGRPAVTVKVEGMNDVTVNGGQVRFIKVPPGPVKVTVRPNGNLDVGAGRGQSRTLTMIAGLAGLMIDGRGRPLIPAGKGNKRIELLRQWLQAAG